MLEWYFYSLRTLFLVERSSILIAKPKMNDISKEDSTNVLTWTNESVVSLSDRIKDSMLQSRRFSKALRSAKLTISFDMKGF